MQSVTLLRDFSFFFATFFCLLVDDFDGQFDFVGLFVRVEFDEGLEEAVHSRSAGLDEVLKTRFVLGFFTPADGFFALVFVVVLEMEDIGALELESADGGNFELAAVETLGSEDGDGFFSSCVGDGIDLSLDGFFLGAQFAQEG